MKNRLLGMIAVFLVGAFATGTVAGGPAGERSAWEALLRADPSAADDPSIGWRERLVLHALTPAQAEAYFRRGADQDTLVVEDGRTLREYLEARLSPPAGLFVALPAPCRLFAADGLEAGARYGVRARGGDLSAQGGSATGCGVPAEATAVVLQVTLEGASSGARLKLWAADGPEPAEGVIAAGDGGAEARRATVVAALALRSGAEGDLLLRSAAAASVDAELIGYFRPPTALDNPTPVVSFYTEGLNNNFFGTNAGYYNTTGRGNAYFGGYAGYNNSTGNYNSFFGYEAGRNNTSNHNAFFGWAAGYANVGGGSNSFFGTYAGGGNISGNDNAFFGVEAGRANTASKNSFFGTRAGRYNTTGSGNAAFGHEAGFTMTTAVNNSFFGYDAGRNATGGYNSFFGRDAGYSNTFSGNSFFGYYAGRANTSGGQNAFFGYYAGRSSTGSWNSFFGYSAGNSNTSGAQNAFFGSRSGYHNTMGSYNNFFGDDTGYSNTTGFQNAFFGDNAGFYNTTGGSNAFFGDGAGQSNTTEHNNSFFGARATGLAGITNATALGYRAQVSQSNSLVLGSVAGLNGMATSVNVGIGTPAPVRQLHLKGSNAVFRMDRDADTAAFMIVRTNAAGSPLKTFVVGTNAAGANNGEFVVNDLGAAVGGAGTRRMTITNAGETHFTGTVRAPTFLLSSSLRFKTEVATLSNALETVERLRGVSFVWKETGRPSVGLIAEEVAEVIPEVVGWEENGLETAGVNYSALVAVLVEAVKTQRERMETQQSELDSLRAELAGLKSELRALRAESSGFASRTSGDRAAGRK